MSIDEKNFRLVKDTRRGKYCFLISLNGWAVELQKSEFNSLYHVLVKINKQISELSDQLMEEELINLEIERLPWYVELEGKKNDWSLRLVFESQEKTRSFEMYWPIPIAKNLFYEIKKMWESMD